MIQKTLVLVKPDAVKRGLSGEIIERFEQAGLKVIAMKMVWADEEFAKNHYREDDIAERHGEDIWKGLLEFISEGPVVAVVLEGVEAIEVTRKIVGGTEPKTAKPGTIRGDYAHHSYDLADEQEVAVRNVVHASANKEEAEMEIDVWFDEEEIHTYKRNDHFDHYGEE